MVFIVLMFSFLDRQKITSFSILLFLGVLTKSTILLMIPTAFIYFWQKKQLDSRQVRVLSLSSAFAVIVALLVRASISTVGGLTLGQALGEYTLIKLKTPSMIYRTFINHFLPFTVLPLIYLRDTKRFFKERTHMLFFLAGVVLSSFLGNNSERLIAPAFIVLYSLLAFLLKENVWSQRFGKPVFSIFVLSAFASSFHPYMGYLNVSKTGLVIILVVSTLAVSLTAFIHKMISGKESVKQP
jgi:hypothetical protein